jgi:hypothetical protein
VAPAGTPVPLFFLEDREVRSGRSAAISTYFRWRHLLPAKGPKYPSKQPKMDDFWRHGFCFITTGGKQDPNSLGDEDG